MAKWNQVSVIRGALRRGFARSPQVQEVKYSQRREVPKYNKDGALAKKPKVEYHCAECDGWYPSTGVAVDHIDPVIPIDGSFVDWNTFVDRLFCSTTNLQLICSYKKKYFTQFGKPSCHYVKTQFERTSRDLGILIKETIPGIEGQIALMMASSPGYEKDSEYKKLSRDLKKYLKAKETKEKKLKDLS
jgi:hypothetical protein